MLHYREISPSPRLAGQVECFWAMRQDGPGTVHRVLPDGCADLLLTKSGAGATLEAVGPMTRFADHAVLEGQSVIGVRFRPGRWSGVLDVPGDRMVDTVVPLEDLWGPRAKALADRLAHTGSAEECARLLEGELPAQSAGPVERAVAFLERAAGLVEVDDLAREAGLSSRQLRRVFLERTGLTPKFLARVLRFRNAAARAGTAGAADLALDCGYYDQAHLIRDFQEFAGRTPGRRQRRRASSSAASMA